MRMSPGSSPLPLPWFRGRLLSGQTRLLLLLLVPFFGFAASGCGGDAAEEEESRGSVSTASSHARSGSSSASEATQEPSTAVASGLQWSLPISDWPAGLLSVSGTAPDDVWVAGAADAQGPAVLHWDGVAWERLEAPVPHNLWWVHALSPDEVFFGGEQGTVLRWTPERFERLRTPALARHTVFGVWARASDDVYAVGGIGSRGGFVWHHDGDQWHELALPPDLPRLHHGDRPALFKVWGDADDLWVVGGLGVVLRSRGGGPLERVAIDSEDTLFTVTGSGAGRVLAVGGGVEGRVLSLAPTAANLSIPALPLLQGVTFGLQEEAWVSGAFGTILREEAGDLVPVAPGLEVPGESLHAIWVDPAGGVWSVGGNVISAALDRGVLVHGAPSGVRAPALLEAPEPEAEPVQCTTPRPDLGAWSVARIWNEEALGAIRRALPEPTVHARNLYHVSLALHDAWAAWEPEREGLIHAGEIGAGGASDRRAAMSHAALRVLEHRYRQRTGGEASMRCFERTATLLGVDPDERRMEGDDAPAIGNRIGAAVIEAFARDGANEHIDYKDPTYRFGN
ncbi:MAG: hypothetical protein EA398_08870, partial [Deltaproteobacteria bacterium]